MTSDKITIRKNEQKELILETLKKTPIIQVVCEKVGVSRATYYRWCKEDEKFNEESNEALLKGKHLVNDVAESQLISAIKDKNLTAIIFWLKHHHKDYKTKVELSGEIKTKGELTPEQEESILKALQLSSLLSSHNSNDK